MCVPPLPEPRANKEGPRETFSRLGDPLSRFRRCAVTIGKQPQRRIWCSGRVTWRFPTHRPCKLTRCDVMGLRRHISSSQSERYDGLAYMLVGASPGFRQSPRLASTRATCRSSQSIRATDINLMYVVVAMQIPYQAHPNPSHSPRKIGMTIRSSGNLSSRP